MVYLGHSNLFLYKINPASFSLRGQQSAHFLASMRQHEEMKSVPCRWGGSCFSRLQTALRAK